MKNLLKYFNLLLVTFSLCIMCSMEAKAAMTVPASGDKSGREDYKAIMNALAEDGDVILEDGSTYYIKATLWVENNQSITATGATIISKTGAFRNKPSQLNYKSIKGFTVDGGTWKNMDPAGFKKAFIQFSHGSNITIKNATVYCNYEGHAIELIACKNVLIDNCNVKAVGKCKSTSAEEQIQIDVATPRTAPTIGSYGAKYVKGQTCQNITVSNCTVVGARGICANLCKDEKYKGKFHKNIVLTNNKVTGMASEAVALFNVVGATVENNTIVTKSKRTTTAYSVGLHIAMFGKAPTTMNKAVYTIQGNTIKGGRQGVFVYSHSSSKFGKVIAKNNKCYAKAGKDKALVVHKDASKQSKLSKNKTYVWK